jgi:hypothetical protein
MHAVHFCPIHWTSTLWLDLRHLFLSTSSLGNARMKYPSGTLPPKTHSRFRPQIQRLNIPVTHCTSNHLQTPSTPPSLLSPPCPPLPDRLSQATALRQPHLNPSALVAGPAGNLPCLSFSCLLVLPPFLPEGSFCHLPVPHCRCPTALLGQKCRSRLSTRRTNNAAYITTDPPPPPPRGFPRS